MANELPRRSEVKREDTWALEDMYESLTAWEKDVEAARTLSFAIEAAKDQLTENGGSLFGILVKYTECSRKLSLASNYAHRASDVDTQDTKNLANARKIDSITVEISSRLAFLEPMILELPEDKLEDFYQNEPQLETYRLYMEEIKRLKAHRLTSEMEALLASAGELQQAPGTIFSIFNNADLQFPEIEDENGEMVRITHGRFITLLNSGDRRVRKDAFTNLYKAYGQYQNSLATIYESQVRQLMFEAKARHYDSTLEAAVSANNVSPAVYNNLIEAIHDNLDKMYRYVSLRKKCLGLDELHMYDIYVPMISDVDRKIPFEEAKETVRKALAPLGSNYTELVKQGFDNRWIDIYENEGKRSGAYSAGAYGVHPYVLLNYDGLLNDMFTLAHEMGHAMHSYFSNETQPYHYADYRIFVAEVASTCNEVLLIEYLLKVTTDKKERAYLLNHFLDSFRTTVYRQTMFAEYEKITNALAEEGESLTTDVLKDVYYELNRKYYGPDMVSDEEIAMEWARIPHFYYNFYVYQYATGFSAAVAIARRILKEGEPAVADYLEFLKGGCTRSPVELLKIAGVNMETKEPIQEALDVFDGLLDEMEQLI
ncbi:MAG: oligoendopeptidase F [Lachnospiraceae bacterium]